MNLYLLKIISCVLGKKTKIMRLLGSSLLGATGYCVILCIPGLPYEQGILIGLIPMGMLLIKITCKTKGMKELLYGTGYLFTFSFLLGGFIIFLKGKIPWLREHSNSALVLAGIGYLGFMIFQGGIKVLEQKKHNHFCKVEVQGDQGILCFHALIDTGNGLKDPISQKPVAILAECEWKNLTRWKRPEKYKMIPFHSIGMNKGMMEGYEIDEVEVKGDTGRIRYENVIIAISKHKISGEGGYQMILPPELSI